MPISRSMTTQSPSVETLVQHTQELIDSQLTDPSVLSSSVEDTAFILQWLNFATSILRDLSSDLSFQSRQQLGFLSSTFSSQKFILSNDLSPIDTILFFTLRSYLLSHEVTSIPPSVLRFLQDVSSLVPHKLPALNIPFELPAVTDAKLKKKAKEQKNAPSAAEIEQKRKEKKEKKKKSSCSSFY
ncbi:hypothetical protein GEMRC1_001288 [Eukaryota sp. GEM-RC1]